MDLTFAYDAWMAGPSSVPPPAVPADIPGIATAPGDPRLGKVSTPTVGRYAASGDGYADRLASISGVLAQMDRQELTHPLGPKLRRTMMRDPAVRAAVGYLVYAACRGPVTLVPNPRPEPGEDVDGSDRAEELRNAATVADYCAWCLDQLETPIEHTRKEMVEGALVERSKLAELEWADDADDGVPVLRPRRIAVKPRDAWKMAVTRTGEVFGYQVKVDEGVVVMDPANFLVFSWDARDGDPRGTSILEAAVECWSLRAQARPEWFYFLKRFGSPGVHATLAPDAPAEIQVVAADGTIATTTPEAHMLGLIENWQAFGCLVTPNGSTVALTEPKGDGEAQKLYNDELRREIFLAILLSTRVLAESQYGSRADSKTAQDVTENLIQYVREWAATTLEWQLLYRIVEYRWGVDWARKYTPSVAVEGADHQDLATLVRAMASVGFKLTPSQVAVASEMLGLPAPTTEELARLATAPEPAPAPVAPPDDDPAGETRDA